MIARGRWRTVAVAATAGVVLSSCIGATSRQEFEQTVRARGGGVTVELFTQPLEQLRARLGTDSLMVASITAIPERATVSVEVRDPAAPQNLDEFDFVGGDVVGEPTPVRLSAGDDLDARTFPIHEVALDRMEEIADTALARFAAAGAWVEFIDIRTTRGEGLRMALTLASPRARAMATFTADGELIEVVRR